MPDFGLDKTALRNIVGLTGPNFVGDTDTQTLANKTMDDLTKFKTTTATAGTQVDITPTFTTVANTTTRSKLRLHNVDDLTNDEFLELRAEGTNGFTIDYGQAGSGTQRVLNIKLNGATIFTFTAGGVLNTNGSTMTNLTTDGINIWNPGVTFRYFTLTSAITANRNITLPLLIADDTYVFQAHTQALTNKTIQDTAQAPRLHRWGCFQASSGTGTTAILISSLTGILSGSIPTALGTCTITYDTTEGVIANFVGTAAVQNLGIVAGTTGPICRRLFGCRMSARVKIDSTTSARMYVGFCGQPLVTASDTVMASGTPGVLVGFTAAATNFEIYSNDDTGATTVTTVTGTIAKNANWHTIAINWTASGNVDVVFDGTTQTLSANIPLTTSNLFFNCVGQCSTTTARTFSIHDIWIECDE